MPPVMTDHEIERIAGALATKLQSSHPCKFSDDERAGLHSFATFWNGLVKVSRIAFSAMIIAAITAAGGGAAWVIWMGFRSVLTQ